MRNKLKGRFGEEFAVKYLMTKGYEIVGTNWTCHWGEIDIVAIDRLGSGADKLVFVEVKYRSSGHYGSGYEAVNFHKRNKLFRSINIYLLQNDVVEDWRFDVISLDKVPGSIRVSHFEDLPLR